jgi:riboflavin kinase/FMN adenylyltransferase
MMQVFDGLERFVSGRPAALTIGNYDGVHLGHRAILRAAQEHAARIAGELVVLTFEPHPLAVLAPQRAPARLTSAAEKLALLSAAGVARTVVLASEPRLLATEADDFLAAIAQSIAPVAIVEGASFNFGRARRGTPETLRAWGATHGVAVEIVPTANCDALPGSPPVSSSAVRAALAAGDVARAAAMLGRPHRVTGIVGRGAGRGAGMGVPTANLEHVPQMLPAEGVYAGVAQLAEGELRPAAVSLGPQPTFADPTWRVEAHLLDFTGDLRGQRMGVWLVERLRGQVAFADVVGLRAQMEKDIADVRRVVAVAGSIAGHAASMPIDPATN